jgi:hypothetical protein
MAMARANIFVGVAAFAIRRSRSLGGRFATRSRFIVLFGPLNRQHMLRCARLWIVTII